MNGRHTAGLSDEVGERVVILDERGAASLELLRFRQTLTTTPGFEVALRRRIERLKPFRHDAFAPPPAVEYLGKDQSLALLSSYTPGRRLTEVLAHAQDPVFASSLIHQLTAVLETLNEFADGVGHGALTASRVVISPSGQPVILEYVLGPALERLHLTASGMRRDLGIPVPETDGAGPRTDGSTDCYQVAVIALSMLLGRPLESAEYSDLDAVLQAALSAPDDDESLDPEGGLRNWLARALQIDGRAFLSLREAAQALRDVRVPQADAQRWRELLDVQSDAAVPRVVPTVLPDVPDLPPSEVLDAALARAQEADFEIAPAGRPADVRTPVFPAPPLLPPIIDDETEEPPTTNRARGFVPAVRTFFVSRDGALRWTIAGVAVVAVIEAVVIVALLGRRAAAPPPAAVAQVAVMTMDPGALVTVNGQSAGVTPLQLTIGPETRSISIASARPLAPKQESIVGSTGQQLGLANANAAARAAADAPARTAPAPPASPRTGGFRVSSPIELEVFAGDTRLGSSTAGILSAPVGRHELDFVNTALGFRSRQAVDIRAGQTSAMTVTPPNGRININAVPWAEVLIDGKPVGETPIGNLSIPLGEHEITFRHPQLGEVRRTAVVRSDAVTRVSASFQR